MHDGVVRTDRLLLRPWRPADRAPFAEMNASPRVMEWFPSTLTRAESDALADRIAEGIGRHGWGEWAVEVPGVADFVGFIGLSSAEATLGYPAVEVGWRLAADYWGRGYAPEGALAALAFGFGQLGLDEIVSFTSVGNTRSRRVMEKTGMTGRPEDDFDHPSLPDGSPLKRHVLYRVAATSHRPEVSATAGMARSAPVEHGEAVVAQGRLAGVVPMNELLDVLPDTAAGQRGKWLS